MKNKIFLCTALLSVLALCGCNQKAEESFSQSDISTAETTKVSVSTSATTSTTTALSTVATTNTTTIATTTAKATATSESDTSVSDKVTETAKPAVDDDGNTLVIEVPEVEDDEGGYNIVIGGDELSEEPVPEPDSTPSYNEDIYEKLGIKVELSGTNEEQAHQYYEACKEAYPNLLWSCGDNDVSIDLYAMRSPDAPDVYSMSPDEVTALIQERLAGRDYHDLSLEELAQIAADCGPGCELGAEIYDYFNDLTSRDFNAGGWTIIG